MLHGLPVISNLPVASLGSTTDATRNRRTNDSIITIDRQGREVTIPTIFVNITNGTIEGTFPPGDRDGLVVALERIFRELLIEPVVPAYVEYDEGKIHAG